MHTFVLDMPLGVKGLSFYDDLGNQIILLNAKYNHETNVKSFNHELSHKDDWQCKEDVSQLEYLRHQK